MFKLGFRSLLCALSFVCAAAPLLTGCAGDQATEVAEDSGTIDLALSTTGADGATYGFPIGTYLTVSSATISEWIPLWGGDTTLNKTLPVGNYSVGLYFQNGDVTLTRTDATISREVSAQWTNPQPVTFSIVTGQTTPLALHFSIETLTDLVFDTGTLQVIADVVAVDTDQAGGAQISGSTNLYDEQYNDATAAYASALDVDLNVDLALALGFQATGDWQQLSSNTVCQNGTLTSASSSGSAGLDRRMAQLVDGVASLCVYDGGTADQVSLYPSRYGAPPAGQETFLPNTEYGFYGGISGVVGDIYDGTTLKQTELQNATLNGGYFSHQIYDNTAPFITVVQGFLTATIQLEP